MDLSINGIDSLYQNAENTSASNLQNTLNTDLSKASEDELMGVCKEFEAYFTEQVFKAMQKMVPDSDKTSSANTQLVDYYKDSLIQQYAKESAEGNGLGIAQMMYEQMKRNYNL